MVLGISRNKYHEKIILSILKIKNLQNKCYKSMDNIFIVIASKFKKNLYGCYSTDKYENQSRPNLNIQDYFV